MKYSRIENKIFYIPEKKELFLFPREVVSRAERKGTARQLSSLPNDLRFLLTRVYISDRWNIVIQYLPATDGLYFTRIARECLIFDASHQPLIRIRGITSKHLAALSTSRARKKEGTLVGPGRERGTPPASVSRLFRNHKYDRMNWQLIAGDEYTSKTSTRRCEDALRRGHVTSRRLTRDEWACSY